MMAIMGLAAWNLYFNENRTTEALDPDGNPLTI